MAIQIRRGAASEFDATKMQSGELAVSTDGTHKVWATGAPGDCWELANENEISELKIELSDLSGLKEYTGTLVEGKYIAQSNGSINDGTGVNYVEFPVFEGVVVYYKFTVPSSTTYGLAFYNNDGKTLASYMAPTAPQTFTAPAQAILCRATVNSKDDVILSNYNGWINKAYQLADGKIGKNTHKAGTNYIDVENVVPGYVNSSGGISKSDTWYSTGFVELEENTQYYYSGLYSGYYAFYDNKGTPVQTATSSLSNPFTIPAGAKFGRFSKNGAITNEVWINTKNEAPSAYDVSWTLDKYLKKNQGTGKENNVLVVDENGDISTNNTLLKKSHNPQTNFINPADVSAGYVKSDGDIRVSGSWHNTGYVELEEGVQYYWSGLYSGSSGYYAFYNSGKEVVQVGSSDLPNPFTPPTGTKYGRFSKNGEITSSVWIYTENSTPPAYGTIDDSDIFIKKQEGTLKAGYIMTVDDDGYVKPKKPSDDEYAEVEVWIKGNLYKQAELVPNKYIYKTGNESSYNNYYCTPFLPVSGDYVYLNGFLNTYYAFYDATKTLVASYDTLEDMEQWTPGIKRATIPSGAVYGRFSSNGLPSSYAFISCEPENPPVDDQKAINEGFPSVYNPANPCDCETGSVSIFHKIVCIGDSLTWGAFNTNGDETINIPSANTLHEWYSYPTYFTKITGVETTNMGDSSETFKSWYELYGNTDFSGHDCAVIHLGVNDASFDKTDEETEEYLCKIVDALKASVMNIKIFVCTVTPVFSTDRFPIHKRKSQVIRDTLAEHYANDPDVILCDIEQYSHVRQYTSYAAGHFTALGYWRFAKDIANFISWHIDNHMREYRFVHFIGSDRTYSGD